VKVILIVDDDRGTRESMKYAFETEGYKVFTAGNVAEAIAVVRTHHVDLAVVDLKMPIVGGYNFCEYLKKRERYAHVGVIILTGAEERYGREEAEELGIDAYLDKPIEHRELMRVVHRILMDRRV